MTPAPGVEDALELGAPAAGSVTALAGVRDGQALAPLRAAPLEHEPPLLRRHADQEPVGLLPVPPVRLKCADALRHDLKNLYYGSREMEKPK